MPGSVLGLLVWSIAKVMDVSVRQLSKAFSGQNDSGHGVTFGLPPGWNQNLPTVRADGLPFSGPSRSPPPVDPLLTGLMNQQLQLGHNDGGFETTATTATSATSPATTTTSWCPRP